MSEFRAKEWKSNEWVYGSLIEKSGRNSHHWYIYSMSSDLEEESQEYYVNEDTICERVPLFEVKNSYEVYTGDIVACSYKPEDGNKYKGLGEIYYDFKHHQFRVKWHEKIFKRIRGAEGEPLFANAELVWTVVGNIIDSPELIK